MGDDPKPLQDQLTADQIPLFENAIKEAIDAAVTKFKTESEDARKKAVPEKYDVKFSDGSPLDPARDLEKIAAYAKAQGFSNEQTQALLKHQEEIAAGLVTRQQAELAGITAGWAEEVKTSKDLGGANYAATLANVKRAVDRFGSAEFKAWVDETGVGNQPHFVRIFNAIGKAMAEERTILSGTAPGDPPKTYAERIYGTK